MDYNENKEQKANTVKDDESFANSEVLLAITVPIIFIQFITIVILCIKLCTRFKGSSTTNDDAEIAKTGQKFDAIPKKQNKSTTKSETERINPKERGSFDSKLEVKNEEIVKSERKENNVEEKYVADLNNNENDQRLREEKVKYRRKLLNKPKDEDDEKSNSSEEKMSNKPEEVGGENENESKKSKFEDEKTSKTNLSAENFTISSKGRKGNLGEKENVAEELTQDEEKTSKSRLKKQFLDAKSRSGSKDAEIEKHRTGLKTNPKSSDENESENYSDQYEPSSLKKTDQNLSSSGLADREKMDEDSHKSNSEKSSKMNSNSSQFEIINDREITKRGSNVEKRQFSVSSSGCTSTDSKGSTPNSSSEREKSPIDPNAITGIGFARTVHGNHPIIVIKRGNNEITTKSGRRIKINENEKEEKQKNEDSSPN